MQTKSALLDAEQGPLKRTGIDLDYAAQDEASYQVGHIYQ